MIVKEVATLLAIAQETGLEGADWAAREPLAEIVAAIMWLIQHLTQGGGAS